MEDEHDGDALEDGVSFYEFAREIENHYRNLVSKASTAPKDAYEHWEGCTSSTNR